MAHSTLGTLYIIFYLVFKLFFSFSFRKMANLNERVKKEKLSSQSGDDGGRGKSKQMKKHVGQERGKEIYTKNTSRKSKQYFCVRYLVLLLLLNCQDGIQSSNAQERQKSLSRE